MRPAWNRQELILNYCPAARLLLYSWGTEGLWPSPGYFLFPCSFELNTKISARTQPILWHILAISLTLLGNGLNYVWMSFQDSVVFILRESSICEAFCLLPGKGKQCCWVVVVFKRRNLASGTVLERTIFSLLSFLFCLCESVFIFFPISCTFLTSLWTPPWFSSLSNQFVLGTWYGWISVPKRPMC